MSMRSLSSWASWAAAQIGQAPGLEQYPRMRCRTTCEVFSDTGLYAVSRGIITSLTTVRVFNNLPNGWSEIHIETGPRAGQRGVVRTENLVLAPSNVIDPPSVLLPGAPVPRPSPIGPLDPDRLTRPPRTEIPEAQPPLPPPVQPGPEPAEPPPVVTTPGPIADANASSPGAAATPWYETAGQLIALTSPAWGAVLLAHLLRR